MLHFKKVHNKGMQFPWHPGRRQFPDRKAILYTTLFEEKKRLSKLQSHITMMIWPTASEPFYSFAWSSRSSQNKHD